MLLFSALLFSVLLFFFESIERCSESMGKLGERSVVMNVIQAEAANAQGKKFAIVAAKWNAGIVDRLIIGARQALQEQGATLDNILLVKVPGSFELPLACLELAQSKCYDAIIALGVLLKGETDHYQLVANEVASGLARVTMETGVPVTFGVIAAEDGELALARAGKDRHNRGRESALAAIEMASVISELRALRPANGLTLVRKEG